MKITISKAAEAYCNILGETQGPQVWAKSFRALETLKEGQDVYLNVVDVIMAIGHAPAQKPVEAVKDPDQLRYEAAVADQHQEKLTAFMADVLTPLNLKNQ